MSQYAASLQFLVQFRQPIVGLSYATPSASCVATIQPSASATARVVAPGGYGIGYQYHLSQRTELYAFYSRVDNDANSAIGIGGVDPSVPGKDPNCYGAGVATQF